MARLSSSFPFLSCISRRAPGMEPLNPCTKVRSRSNVFSSAGAMSLSGRIDAAVSRNSRTFFGSAGRARSSTVQTPFLSFARVAVMPRQERRKRATSSAWNFGRSPAVSVRTLAFRCESARWIRATAARAQTAIRTRTGMEIFCFIFCGVLWKGGLRTMRRRSTLARPEPRRCSEF